jgi:hypothetical protein
MNEDEKLQEDIPEEQTMPADEILQDRDVLMMEKPMRDNRAAGYKTADKKLLRNIALVVAFLIAVLIILMFIVRGGHDSSTVKPSDAPKDADITAPV